jgi:hypothetical protein
MFLRDKIAAKIAMGKGKIKRDQDALKKSSFWPSFFCSIIRKVCRTGAQRVNMIHVLD